MAAVWQQSRLEYIRTHSDALPRESRFSPYISHMPGCDRTHLDMLIRIVALEEVAGSSPVSHPLSCGIERLRQLLPL